VSARAWAWVVVPSWLLIACAISPRTVEELPNESGTAQTGGASGKAPTAAAGGALTKGGSGAGTASTAPVPGLDYAGYPNDDCFVGVDPNWIAPTGNEAVAGAGGESACDQGLCGPVTVASTRANVFGAYLHSGVLYWTDGDGSGVSKVSLSTGIVTHLACEQPYGSLVVADEENVYFTPMSGTKLSRVPVNGGVVTPVIAGLNASTDIAIDETDVYLAGGSFGEVWAFSKASFALRIISGKASASRLAVDATNVYWGGANGIYRAPKLGNSVTAPVEAYLARVQVDVAGLAIDDEYVYWADDFGIERVRKDLQGATDTSSEF